MGKRRAVGSNLVVRLAVRILHLLPPTPSFEAGIRYGRQRKNRQLIFLSFSAAHGLPVDGDFRAVLRSSPRAELQKAPRLAD